MQKSDSLLNLGLYFLINIANYLYLSSSLIYDHSDNTFYYIDMAIAALPILLTQREMKGGKIPFKLLSFGVPALVLYANASMGGGFGLLEPLLLLVFALLMLLWRDKSRGYVDVAPTKQSATAFSGARVLWIVGTILVIAVGAGAIVSIYALSRISY